jgi:hypothetical protein
LEFSDKYFASSQLDKKQSSIKIDGHKAIVSHSTLKLPNFTPLNLIPKLVVIQEWIWWARYMDRFRFWESAAFATNTVPVASGFLAWLQCREIKTTALKPWQALSCQLKK